MPPAAATECDRTGWTLLMSATEAPASAAASAPRWPARPAPMMRTSCAGMASWMLLGNASRHRRAQRAADLLDRHDAAQAVVAVDDHQRSERAQALGADELLDRRVVAHAEGLVGLGIDDVGDRQGRATLLHRAVDAVLVQEAEEAS